MKHTPTQMTANRMMDLSDDVIGFEQHDAPVTNTLKVQSDLTDGNVEVSFCSTWAQAGASHSTDGALVLSQADAEALAAVLTAGTVTRTLIDGKTEQLRSPNFIFASGGDKNALRPDLGDRRFFVIEPPSDDRLAELSSKVARATTAMENAHVRAALIAAGWLPPERLDAIAASWDDVPYISGAGRAVGTRLRAEFKGAPL